jgi:hypothetical protein
MHKNKNSTAQWVICGCCETLLLAIVMMGGTVKLEVQIVPTASHASTVAYDHDQQASDLRSPAAITPDFFRYPA